MPNRELRVVDFEISMNARSFYLTSLGNQSDIRGVLAIPKNRNNFGKMLKYIFVLSFFLVYVKCNDVTSDEKWDNFKIKWTLTGEGGSLDQPKTKTDAISKKWNPVTDKVRGCSKGNK